MIASQTLEDVSSKEAIQEPGGTLERVVPRKPERDFRKGPLSAELNAVDGRDPHDENQDGSAGSSHKEAGPCSLAEHYW